MREISALIAKYRVNDHYSQGLEVIPLDLPSSQPSWHCGRLSHGKLYASSSYLQDFNEKLSMADTNVVAQARRTLENDFCKNVMPALLWASIPLQKRSLVATGILHQSPRDIVEKFLEVKSSASESDTAWSLFVPAVAEVLPLVPPSPRSSNSSPSANTGPADSGELSFSNIAGLYPLIETLSENWSNGTEKIQPETHDYTTVEKTVSDQLLTPLYREYLGKLKQIVEAEKASSEAALLQAAERERINTVVDALNPMRTPFRVYGKDIVEGPIVFESNGYLGQHAKALYRNAEPALVLHRREDFDANCLPPVHPSIHLTVCYSDGKAIWRPALREYQSSEKFIRSQLARGQDFPMTPLHFAMRNNDLLQALQKACATEDFPLQTFSHDSTGALVRWDTFPQETFDFLEKVDFDLLHVWRATARPYRDAYLNFDQAAKLGFYQVHETAQSLGIRQQEQGSFAQIQRGALENHEAIARGSLAHESLQTYAQEQSRHMLLEESAQRSALERVQVRRVQALLPKMEGIERQHIQQQEQVAFQSREGMHAQEMQTLLTAIESINRQAIQQQEHAAFESLQPMAKNLHSAQVFGNAWQFGRNVVQNQEERGFLEIQKSAQAEQAQHLQQKASKLEQLQHQLTTQAAALDFRERTVALNATESQARFEIKEQQLEAFADLKNLQRPTPVPPPPHGMGRLGSIEPPSGANASRLVPAAEILQWQAITENAGNLQSMYVLPPLIPVGEMEKNGQSSTQQECPQNLSSALPSLAAGGGDRLPVALMPSDDLLRGLPDSSGQSNQQSQYQDQDQVHANLVVRLNTPLHQARADGMIQSLAARDSVGPSTAPMLLGDLLSDHPDSSAQSNQRGQEQGRVRAAPLSVWGNTPLHQARTNGMHL